VSEELEVLKQHVESLGLDMGSEIKEEHLKSLYTSLIDSDEKALAGYVKGLKNAEELHNLIVNTLYG